MRLRVAGAQLPVTKSVQSNLAAIRRALAFAVTEGADILLTPEGSLSGYTPHFDRAEVREALQIITGEAAEAGVGLALGTCYEEPEDGLCYNQIRFYDRNGGYLGFHSKTLTCGTMTDPPQGEINDYAVAPLRTFAWGDLTIGGLICNDLWANPTCTPVPDPHLTHILAKMGARVIFHAVNGGRDGSELSRVNWHFHESNLRLRTMAANLYVVTADSCSPIHLPCSAPSGVLDRRGNWIVQAPPQGEQFFVTTLELKERTDDRKERRGC
jgi:predicted amidohydrolase